MNFKQFLKESNLTLEDILKECEPFLHEAQGEFIYRGVTKPYGKLEIETPLGELDIYKQQVRQDRKPRDSAGYEHEQIDQYLFDQFGIRGRSQTVFVSGSATSANEYGVPYIVLPRGDFKFIWSPVVSDLFGVNRFTDIIDQMEIFKYQTDDLYKAIKSRNEIMISCKDYYLIPNSKSIRDMLKELTT